MKKIFAIVLTLCLTLFSVGCSGTTQQHSDKTVIKVVNYDGGVGTKWLKDAAARFEAEYADVSFENGKTGVYVDVKPDSIVHASTMLNSGYNVYFDENSSIHSAIDAGFAMDISDIVTEKDETRDGEPISIEDKIDPTYRSLLQGNDGKYYALPHYEWSPGCAYDVDVFTQKRLFFADSANDGDYYSSNSFGEAYFTDGLNEKKSCGPDGEYGTDDDGLPSTLKELALLCEYMKSRKGVIPFQMSGLYTGGFNQFTSALWASLAGYDEIRTAFTFDGEVEIVTGFSNELLFPNINYIYKPITQKVTVTEGSGYNAFNSVSRYYAVAFASMIYKEGWLSTDATDTSVTHIGAESRFIRGLKNGKPMGFLMTGSYWYNESDVAGNFDDYYKYDATDDSERIVAWMSLPTSFDTKTTEHNGRKPVNVDTAYSFCYINNNISKNAALVKACKEFVKFLYRDSELTAFTLSTGIGKSALDYSVPEDELEKLPVYKQRLWHMRSGGSNVYCNAENETFKSLKVSLCLRSGHFALTPVIEGTTYSNFLRTFTNNKTVQEAFLGSGMTKGGWSSLCKVAVE